MTIYFTDQKRAAEQKELNLKYNIVQDAWEVYNGLEAIFTGKMKECIYFMNGRLMPNMEASPIK